MVIVNHLIHPLIPIDALFPIDRFLNHVSLSSVRLLAFALFFPCECWCPWRESNPHSFAERDFESRASTSSATRALIVIYNFGRRSLQNENSNFCHFPVASAR